MSAEFLNRMSQRIEAGLSRPWEGEANLVGTLVDRHIVRIAGGGESPDDAIIVFLEAIRNASRSSWIFEQMWKTIRPDKTVDLWLYNPRDPWRSVSFEVQFHHMFPIEDLYMVVSTFVPFGAGEDSSHYPIEQSTAYVRATQDLRAIFSMQARRIVRSTSQESSSSERHRSISESREGAHRQTFTNSSIAGLRFSSTSGYSEDESAQERHGWAGSHSVDDSTNSESTRRSTGSEMVRDHRREQSAANVNEQSWNERSHSEQSERGSTSHTSEDLVELTEDVSFMAIGPDFTQPDRLWKSWRADPGNSDPSLTIDMMLASMPAMGRVIENGLSHRRMASRARRRANEETDFWSEVPQLIARYNPEAYGRRVVLCHDGHPHPIRPADVALAIQEARQSMGQLTGRSHFLLEE